MPNLLYRRWNLPDHSPLADLYGWHDDITSARQFFQGSLKAFLNDDISHDAFDTAAVIRYGRCFAKGNRAKLEFSQLEQSDDVDAQTHNLILGVRNFHVAHAINKQEVASVLITLDGSPSATSGAVGFSGRLNRLPALAPSETEDAVRLCEKWEAWLLRQIVKENIRLQPFAGMLSRSEILALPEDELEPNPNFTAMRPQSLKRGQH